MISGSLKETQEFANDFIKSLFKSVGGEALVVGLHGDLGSGKTTFVQCVARSLGVKTHITSPTFLIVKNYKLQTTNYKLLYHIDAYRLKNGEELLKLGWQELLADPENLIFIEWSERVADILPKDYVKLNFEFVDATTRKIWREESRRARSRLDKGDETSS